MAKKSLHQRMAAAEAQYAAQCRAAGVPVNDLWKDLDRVFVGKELRDAIAQRCESWEARAAKKKTAKKKTAKKRTARGGRAATLKLRRSPTTSALPRGPRGPWHVLLSKRVEALFKKSALKDILDHHHDKATAAFQKNPHCEPIVGQLKNASEREPILVVSSAQDRITMVHFPSESYPKDFRRPS